MLRNRGPLGAILRQLTWHFPDVLRRLRRYQCDYYDCKKIFAALFCILFQLHYVRPVLSPPNFQGPHVSPLWEEHCSSPGGRGGEMKKP
jgi:hypothetical protein